MMDKNKSTLTYKVQLARRSSNKGSNAKDSYTNRIAPVVGAANKKTAVENTTKAREIMSSRSPMEHRNSPKGYYHMHVVNSEKVGDTGTNKGTKHIRPVIKNTQGSSKGAKYNTYDKNKINPTSTIQKRMQKVKKEESKKLPKKVSDSQDECDSKTVLKLG